MLLIVDGALHGQLRHRAVGIVIGLLLVLPLLVVLVFRERGFRLVKLGVFVWIPALALLLVAEIGLRISGAEGVASTVLIEDPVLGHRALPVQGGMDERGYRNAEVPDTVDVVCIGDSNTFGFLLRREETWPSALARRSGATVYNMSLGGYGPVQYGELTQSALAMTPSLIIVGLYFGNDLIDAHLAAGLEHWKELRDPKREYAPFEAQLNPRKPAPNLAMAGVEAFVEHSRVGNWVFHTITRTLRANRALAATYSHEVGAPRYERGSIHTLFTPAYRAPALDTQRPAVADGVRITRQCLEKIHSECDAHGVEVALLLLPTKEFCYHQFMASSQDADAEALAELAAKEAAARQVVIAAAEGIGFRVVDPLPAFTAALAADQPLYSGNADGHVNANACELIAEVLDRELAQALPRGPR